VLGLLFSYKNGRLVFLPDSFQKDAELWEMEEEVHGYSDQDSAWDP
jgi:hypothetical protein